MVLIMVFNTILTVIYIAFLVLVALFVIINMFRTKKIYEKIIAAIILIVLLLRIFLIK